MRRDSKHFVCRSMLATMVLLVLGGVLTAGPVIARAADNGVECTPIQGWSTWSFLRQDPTAAKVKAQAQALKDSGLFDLGYRYINLDDMWYQCPGPQGPNVDANGLWVIDATRYPPEGETNGIKALADWVHGMGMKFGIYLTPGVSKQAVKQKSRIAGTAYTVDQIAKPSVKEANYNCKGMVGIDYSKPGAQEYINSWANRFASWGVDFVKFDGIFNKNVPDIQAWSNAIRQSGRPMVLDVTHGGFTKAIAPALMKYANQWVFAEDVECYECEKEGSSYPLTSWPHIANRFDIVAEWQPYVRPGAFNDYDSIEVGNGDNNGLTPDERKTQLSLWALGASPLILGVDLTHLDPDDLKLLKNTAVIDVDQDAIAARRILKQGGRQVFAKVRPNGEAIVGLFNTGAKAQKVSVDASAAGLAASEQGYSLDDLWAGQTEKAGSRIEAMVPPHGVVLYRVSRR